MTGVTPRNPVSQFKGSGHSYPDPLNEKRLRVWVGNIPENVNAREFAAALSAARVPPLSDLILKSCPVRSWGFLTFYTQEEAEEGIRILQGNRIFPDSDFALEARFANPHESKDPGSHHTNSNQSGDTSKPACPTILNSVSRNLLLNSLAQDHLDVLQNADDSTLWHVYKDGNDVPYYYNRITGCTQWERPVPPLLAVETAINDRSRMGSPPGTNLFIFHIPPSWDDTELAMHFTPFGNLVSAKVQTDANGNNAGFGFISYDNHESAAAAVRLMNGYATNSKFLKVEFKKAEYT